MANNPVWALFDGVFQGLLYAALIVISGLLETDPVADDLYLRALFGFVVGVCSKPALDGAMIELASDKPPRFGRFHYGWAMGSMWGLVMILAFWPLSPQQLAVWMGGAVFFGAFVALSYKPTEIPAARVNLYNVSHNIYDGWHPLWRIGPGLFLVCLWSIVFLRSAGEDNQSPYLIFGLAAALINSSFPYYFRHRGLLALQFSGVIAIIAGYLSL